MSTSSLPPDKPPERETPLWAPRWVTWGAVMVIGLIFFFLLGRWVFGGMP